MAFLTDLSLEDARAVASTVGVEVARMEALDAGSVNSNFRVTASDGARYFLRIYEEQSFDGAERERRLLDALSASGVPVVVPLPALAAAPSHAGKPVALYPWMDGELLCQARVTPAACEAVGRALGRVHVATSKVPAPAEGRFRVEDLLVRLDLIRRTAPPELASASDGIREALAKYQSRRDPTLPRGLVHGDLFRDNVLWRGDRIAALLDFESASLGTFAFDLMVTLQAWCFGDAFGPELVEAMVRGYVRERPLEPSEVAALPTEGAIAALRFATTRITDYSMRAPAGSPPKRDYRRFLARLAALEGGALEAPVARGLGPRRG